MKKGILYSAMAVAMVLGLGLGLGLILPMAVPVYAADVGLTKGVTPATPNEYQLGDTIHYTMSIINWSGQENVVVEAVWDVLPDGSIVYPAGRPTPYTLGPGQSQSYTYDWVATVSGTVINTFYAHGYQISTGGNDDFTEQIQKSSTVIAGAPTPEWRRDIQPGDVLLHRSESALNCILFWTHAGIYVGNGKVAEARGNNAGGIALYPIQDWDYPNDTWVGLRRVETASESQRLEAAQWAKEQTERLPPDKPCYGLHWGSKSPDADSPYWYCSELVWAAYYNQGVNIDAQDSGLPPYVYYQHQPVLPDDIFFDDDVGFLGHHLERLPLCSPLSLIVKSLSPVDLVVTDPDGFIVSKELAEIPESTYVEYDLDQDASPEDLVAISGRKAGDYCITVIPDESASPGDTYSLQVSANGTTITLAEDVRVSDIPSQGYIIRCTETELIQIVPTTIDFDPDTLYLKSKDTYVTAYVELPPGFDVRQIDIASIRLNGVVPALTKPTRVGDYDKDKVPDLMVKFDARAVKGVLTPGRQVITITGEVAGIAFEGNDIIRVISP